MKHLLLTTVAAVLLVGCGAKAPDISIHHAARDGNIEAVKQHIAAGTDVNAKGYDPWGKEIGGWTSLHLAAIYGHKEIAELLIAKGADVNAKDGRGGWTALHDAASEGHKEIAELLIDNSADVNAETDLGTTPLDAAINFNRTKTATLLRKHGGRRG